MIAVNLDEGALFDDRALKDRIAGEADYARMIGDFDASPTCRGPKGD